jgi:type VI secretion system protein ImpA
MATPPRIDVDALLRPIPPDRRPGSDADREAVYAAFRQALRGGDVSSQDPRPGGGQTVDLGELIERGCAYLARGAKDLVIAAWMAESLTQRSGVAGLRDGLVLVRGLLADCWDDCYPPLGRDGDPDLRARPLASLASEGYLLLRLRRSSLADPQAGAAPFCILDVRKAPGSTALLTEAEIESGPIGEAVGRSPRRFYERLADDVRQAQEAERALAAAIRERFPDEPPKLDPLRQALAEYQEVVERLLAIKRRQEPDPASNGQAEADGVPVPGPREAASTSPIPAVSGPTPAALDYGRVLIAFSERARSLADASERLKTNRKEYEELLTKLKELDAEYEEITGRIAQDRDFGALLAQRRAGPPEGPPAG